MSDRGRIPIASWPARFEAAWIRENVAPWSSNDGVRQELLIIQAGYDARGLPKFRVPAGKRSIKPLDTSA